MPIIHVNMNTIRSNKKHNKNDPPISVRKTQSGKPTYCHSAEFDGFARVVYDPDNPLPCGARLWIEVDGQAVDCISNEANIKTITRII